jgi:hypothetical protein
MASHQSREAWIANAIGARQIKDEATGRILTDESGSTMTTKTLTSNQLDYLQRVRESCSYKPTNWAGCSYSTLAALVKKGLVKRMPAYPERSGFSKWDRYSPTEEGDAVLKKSGRA